MKHLRSVGRAAALALTLALAGCGHVPMATMAKLRHFEAAEVAPEGLRVAMRAPDWLEPRPGGASIAFRLARRDGSGAREERFALEQAEEPAETVRLAEHRRAGARVTAWRLAAADAPRVRAFQAESRRLKAADPSFAALEIRPALDACRRGELRPGPILTTTFLQPDPATGYLVLLDKVDLREAAAKAGRVFDAELPVCGKSALRAP